MAALTPQLLEQARARARPALAALGDPGVAQEGAVREDLRRRLRVSDDQLQSILRLLQSQLDVTLGRLLE